MSSRPDFRLQLAPHDRHVIHSRYAFSRNALCSMGYGQSEIRTPNLPLVVVWMAPDLDRWSLVSLSARVSCCGIFLFSPQLVVPDSLSGVDFLSLALPVVSSREFRPESSDITGLWKLYHEVCQQQESAPPESYPFFVRSFDWSHWLFQVATHSCCHTCSNRLHPLNSVLYTSHHSFEAIPLRTTMMCMMVDAKSAMKSRALDE